MSNVSILNMPVAVSLSGAEYVPIVQGGSNFRAQLSLISGFSAGNTAESANVVYSGPSTGSAAPPSFRALVSADLPSAPSVSGTVTAKNATASGATATAGLTMGSAGVGIYFGTGNPSFSAAQGSLYIRTDASSTTSRLWINTTGSTSWAFFTSSA